jgi:organic radical activating enzyme
MKHKVFPIQTETACQLKWNWSTIYLTTEETASCHRTTKHKFDTDTFNFHNTPEKVNDRQQMLNGNWPSVGCEYCKQIESAGGQSDRLTSNNMSGTYPPLELDHDLTATTVTPRILEVYFNNTCNLKCLYCGPTFSSLWESENNKFGAHTVGGVPIIKVKPQKSQNIDSNREKIFEWLKHNSGQLTTFNILGGEPLYQKELDQVLDLFESYPAPELTLQFFTNLNTNLSHLQKTVIKIFKLIKNRKIRKVEITASLDCWGPEQEYVRFPLDLRVWEENFNFLLTQKWLTLIVSSTLTPLTIKTFPDLLAKINTWNETREVYHYQNSVNGPSPFFIDIFGDIFLEDFDRALELKPSQFPEQVQSQEYLRGIAKQSASAGPRPDEIFKLYHLLTEMDKRRGTNWKTTFPWLITEFDKYAFGTAT